jgi:F-type H+-transporting ATPase subunit a
MRVAGNFQEKNLPIFLPVSKPAAPAVRAWLHGMIRRPIILTLTAWLACLAPTLAAGDGGHHSLPFDAPVLVDLGFFKITNSMVAMWLVAAVIIFFAQMATRRISLVPTGLQNLFETIVEGLQDFLATIMGEKLAKETFWFFGSIFIFIMCANWMGLFPMVGTVGHYLVDASGHHHSWVPWLRGANADLNMTLGLALVFFAMWLYWSVKANGPGGFLAHIFLYQGEGKGLMKAMLIVIFFLVGFLEIVSIMIRPLTLTFRLYGNIYAGESLLELMLFMGGKWFGWLAALPFYFLELMVGAIQALVFTLLTAVFTSLMCHHEEGDHGH